MALDPKLLALIENWLPYVLTTLLTFAIALLLFVYQMFRYGPAIRALNRFETIAKLAYFADRLGDATTMFGKAAAAADQVKLSSDQLKADLEALRDFIADAQERISEYNAETITRTRLEDDQVGPAVEAVSKPLEGLAKADRLYNSMMAEWQRFLDVFKIRAQGAGISLNLRRIGRMTYEMADRRRRNPLPNETAELITALHSQYRRYTRMRESRSEWLTQELHDNFVHLLATAIGELNKPNNQGDLSLESKSMGKASN